MESEFRFNVFEFNPNANYICVNNFICDSNLKFIEYLINIINKIRLVLYIQNILLIKIQTILS